MNMFLDVYICALRKKSALVLNVQTWHHSKFTNRQRMPTKINKNGSAAKVRILVGLGIL